MSCTSFVAIVLVNAIGIGIREFYGDDQHSSRDTNDRKRQADVRLEKSAAVDPQTNQARRALTGYCRCRVHTLVDPRPKPVQLLTVRKLLQAKLRFYAFGATHPGCRGRQRYVRWPLPESNVQSSIQARRGHDKCLCRWHSSTGSTVSRR